MINPFFSRFFHLFGLLLAIYWMTLSTFVCMWVWRVISRFRVRPISISYLVPTFLFPFRLTHHKNGSIQEHIYPSQIPIGVIFSAYIFKHRKFLPLMLHIMIFPWLYPDYRLSFFYYIWIFFFLCARTTTSEWYIYVTAKYSQFWLFIASTFIYNRCSTFIISHLIYIYFMKKNLNLKSLNWRKLFLIIFKSWKVFD